MDQVKLYAAISKTDEDKHMVYGYASTEALDSQGEVVKKDALKSAISDYMKFANIREMHQPSAVGKTKKAQIDDKGLYIAAKVVDKNAWEKVKEGVYSGFSIGGRVLQMVDNEITDLKLAEISLVDRPANPEAIIDVWKADGVKETKKDVYGASFLVDMACRLATYIEGEKYNKEDTKDAEKALKSIKSALIDEVKEPEYFENIGEMMGVGDAVAYAESVLDLKKAGKPAEETTEIKPAEDQPVGEEGKIEEDAGKDSPQITAIEEDSPTPEDVPGSEPETTAPPPEEEGEEGTGAELEEDKPPEDAEKTPQKVVEDKLTAWQMPTEDELVKYCEAEEIQIVDGTIAFMKERMAGKILELVEKSMQGDKNQQMVAKFYEKIKEENAGKDISNLDGYNKVAALIAKFEGLLAKDVTPAEDDRSGDNGSFEEVVRLISLFNEGKALTDDEKKLLANGLASLSERVGGGHISDPLPNGESIQNAEMPEMKKLEDEVTALKAEVEKLKNTPEPVRVFAPYVTVEKFETPKSDELKKAEQEVDEVSEELKMSPNDLALQKKAAELSDKVMKLRRASS